MLPRTSFLTLSLSLSLTLAGVGTAPLIAQAAEPIDTKAIEILRKQGLEKSQVMDHLSWMCDVHGPRLTGSPNLRRAQKWALATFEKWGLKNPHLEKWGPFGVEIKESTVNELIAATPDLGTFNLVYTAGPYDLLSRPAAIRLTNALFEATRPGGLLLVSNFLGGIKDVGYMEAFMDWRIHYRDAAEMFALTSGLPEDEIGDRRTFAEETGGIVFLAVRRR